MFHHLCVSHFRTRFSFAEENFLKEYFQFFSVFVLLRAGEAAPPSVLQTVQHFVQTSCVSLSGLNTSAG